jgi:Ca2+-binding EF-hand superfamily protein
MTRNDVAARMRTMFARLDINRDGALTQDEAQAAARRHMGEARGQQGRRARQAGGQMDPAQRAARRAAAFDRIDLDHNGVVTRDEFANVRGMGQGRAGAGGRRMGGAMGARMLGRMFTVADGNRDGRLSLNEATDAALRHFDMIDRNRDGRITPDERPARRGARQG